MGKRRLKAIVRVDSLTLCGIGLQGTIAWVLSAFRRKDNCTHRDKVTLLLLIERRGRKAHGFEGEEWKKFLPNEELRQLG